MRGGRHGGMRLGYPSTKFLLAFFVSAAVLLRILVGVADPAAADVRGDLCSSLGPCGTSPFPNVVFTLGILVVLGWMVVEYMRV